MIITLCDVKRHLNITDDCDDELLTKKIYVAGELIGAYVGGIEKYNGVIPAPLQEAARQLVAGWYESRESVSDEHMRLTPLGVHDLIAPYRCMVF